jgi:glycosyltransferase involved in cell wall biosynthesis
VAAKVSPAITVVVCCHDQWQYLGEAVDSLDAQTFRDFETILAYEERLSNGLAFSDRFDRICWSQKRLGLAGARNYGFRAARSHWVLPLDADDTLEPNCLQLLYDAAVDTKANIVAPNCECSFGKSILEYNYLPYCSLIERYWWKEIGGYHPVIFEDWDFWMRTYLAGGTVANIPDTLFHWRQHSDSGSAPYQGGEATAKIGAELRKKNGVCA